MTATGLHCRFGFEEREGDMRMGFSELDGMVVRWSMEQGCRCEWGPIPGEADRGVKVVMRHATVYFRNGTLTQIVCRQDGRHASNMVRELADVFAFCGYIAAVRECPDTQTQTAPSRPDEVAIGN